MLFKSEVVTQASGSIGGVTYAHNRGGLYRRARAIPVDPNSAAQVVVRDFFADLAVNWSTLLTEAQREAWRTYAAAVPLTGPLGDARDVGGMAMFIRNNTVRLRAGLALVDDAPTNLNVGNPPTNVVLTATVAAGFSITASPAGAAVESVVIQQGRNTNQGQKFFKGPFRFAGVETPPASPYVLAFAALPFPFVADQRAWARLRFAYTDGRVSLPVIVSDITAA